jgi:hypothetical protein
MYSLLIGFEVDVVDRILDRAVCVAMPHDPWLKVARRARRRKVGDSNMPDDPAEVTS